MSSLLCQHIQHEIDAYKSSVGDIIVDNGTEIAIIGDKKTAILSFIADNPGVKASITAAYIGLKPSRTYDYLAQLVKEGKVLTEGANKNRTYKLA